MESSQEITARTRILAVCLGILPIYGWIIWSHLTRTEPYQLKDMLLYPMVAGGLWIIWTVFLHKVLCGEPLGSLVLKPGRWWKDLVGGALLAVLLLALHFGMQQTLYQWFPREPVADLMNLVRGLSESPLLLGLWLGPVVWIGIAGFEELSRVFLLKHLWDVWKSPSGRWAVLLFSACLMGAAHLYQGTAGVISIGILSIIKGWVYLKFGRLWPLIVAHALYDSVQIIWVVSLIRRGFI